MIPASTLGHLVPVQAKRALTLPINISLRILYLDPHSYYSVYVKILSI